MKREEFITLFLKYRNNLCNAEEAEKLIRYIKNGRNRQLVKELMDGLPQSDTDSETFEMSGIRESLDQVFNRVQQTKHNVPFQRHGHRIIAWQWASVAAALLIVGMSVLWYVAGKDVQQDTIVNLKTHDIDPGGNRATLTLADGQSIALSEAEAGIVVGAERITYQDGTAAVAVLEDKNTTKPKMLSLTTPRGGTYRVTLPDGTKVWLNAASTLSYPNRFVGNERRVTLSGEGYFEVVKDESKPFRVESRGQQVEVLGTQFNISAYPDEAATKTTLVEGAVRLGSNAADITLSPGEQGILYDGKIQVEAVNVATYVGWKNGEFVFNGIELHDAMMQLSRWYDLEVVYEGEISPTPFYGSFSRSSTLAKTLDILKEAKVNFSVQKIGSINRLVVRP